MVKHALYTDEDTCPKRAKKSKTPVDTTNKNLFTVHYPQMASKRALSKGDQDLVDHADFQVSSFTTKGATEERELDQHYTVTPFQKWESMKKYNNFTSK